MRKFVLALHVLMPALCIGASAVPVQEKPLSLRFDGRAASIDGMPSSVELQALPPAPKIAPQDMVELTAPLSPAVLANLESVFGEAIVDNSAAAGGVKARRPNRDAYGGAFLRIAQWNINDSREPLASIAHPNGYKNAIRGLGKDERASEEAARELDALVDADVLVLNETGLDHVQWMAQEGGYNYAFGVALVEIDPRWSERRGRGRAFLGRLHGSAILSRYPIVRAESDPLESYDWYNGELKKLSALERGKRLLVRFLLKEDVESQVRLGNDGRFRNAVIAQLRIPGASESHWTIVATQFENYAQPKLRRREMRELLGIIHDIAGPVVIAGDLNTSGLDPSPTSVRKEAKDFITDPQRVIGTAISVASHMGVPFMPDASNGMLVAQVVHHMRRLKDPTVHSIPFLSRNKERGLFADMEHFRFADGSRFDVKAKDDRTRHGRGGKFAGSNERDWKGFKDTYRTDRSFGGPIQVGREKTDWIFSKDMGALNPRCPRTLQRLNLSRPGDRYSDHAPIYADFPLQLPPKTRGSSCP